MTGFTVFCMDHRRELDMGGSRKFHGGGGGGGGGGPSNIFF